MIVVTPAGRWSLSDGRPGRARRAPPPAIARCHRQPDSAIPGWPVLGSGPAVTPDRVVWSGGLGGGGPDGSAGTVTGSAASESSCQ